MIFYSTKYMIEEILAKHSSVEGRLFALYKAGYMIDEKQFELTDLIDMCNGNIMYDCDWIDSAFPYIGFEFGEELRNYVLSVAKDREGLRLDEEVISLIPNQLIELNPKVLCVLPGDYSCMFAYSRYEIRDNNFYVIPEFYEIAYIPDEYAHYKVDLSEAIMLSILNENTYDPETMANVPYICCKKEIPGYNGTLITDYNDLDFLDENSPFKIYEQIRHIMLTKKSVIKK